MEKYGAWTEQEDTRFRTSGDSKVLTLTPPANLTGASSTLTLPDISGTTDTMLSRTSADLTANRITNKDVDSATFGISDGTNRLRLDISALSTDRTLAIPNDSGAIVTTSAVQTLTNKTIDGDDNTVQDLALTSLKTTANTNVFLQRDGTGIVIDSTKAVPSGTVVGTSDAQTLTNKTIDADSNTITNIENADIKAAANIALSKLASLTAVRALATDGTGEIVVSTATAVELTYLSGVTSGIQSQLNTKQADVVTTEGDIILGNVSGDAARLGIGANGTVLTSNGTTASWATPAGTGDVTASANIADNALVRGDGGAKGIQQSGITVDDSDNISGVGTLAMGDNLDVSTGTGVASIDIISGAAELEVGFNDVGNGVGYLALSNAAGTAELNLGLGTVTNGVPATNILSLEYNSGAPNVDITGTMSVSEDTTIGTDALFVDVSADSVGMGTASPDTTSNLHVSQVSSSAQIKLERTGTSTGSVWIGSASGDFRLGTTAGGTDMLTVSAAGVTTVTDDLVVDTDTLFADASADKVGINDSSPDQSLTIGDASITAFLNLGLKEDNTRSIAGSGSSTWVFPSQTGIVTVTQHNNDYTAMYFLRAGNGLSEVLDPDSNFAITTTPAGSTVGVDWNNGTNTFTVYNGFAGAVNYSVMFLALG